MFKVWGVGYAMVDKKIAFDENHPSMKSFLPNKGMFISTSQEDFEVLNELKSKEICGGGSVANSMRTMATLGIKTAYSGKIGHDENGDFFKESLVKSGVEPRLIYSEDWPSGGCLVMVHEDGEKTICAKANAAKAMNVDDFVGFDLSETEGIFGEGYVLNHQPEVIMFLHEEAKRLGKKLYLTLSDATCVRDNRELILAILEDVDILFGNEKEFEVLGVNESELPRIAVKTMGADGCEVWADGVWNFYEPLRCDNLVNTNGAGDAFAAGFLCAFVNGKSVDDSVALANETAVKVLSQEGSYLV